MVLVFLFVATLALPQEQKVWTWDEQDPQAGSFALGGDRYRSYMNDHVIIAVSRPFGVKGITGVFLLLANKDMPRVDVSARDFHCVCLNKKGKQKKSLHPYRFDRVQL